MFEFLQFEQLVHFRKNGTYLELKEVLVLEVVLAG